MIRNRTPPKPVRKTSNFDQYVAERTAHLEVVIQQAVRIIDPKKFSNVTHYCKAVSAIVTEVRNAKSGDPNTPFYDKKLKSFSYVTLLRNKNYRKIVDLAFNRDVETTEVSDVFSEQASLRIASLQAQINLLKDRLSSIKTGESQNALTDHTANEMISKLKGYLTNTIDVYTAFRHLLDDVIKVVDRPTERYKIPGIYSARGLVSDLEKLQHIEEGRRFLESLNKF